MARAYDSSPEPRRFSRSWWLGAGKTFLQVAVVTVLIWVYADLEKTEEERFSLKLVLQADPAKMLALLDKTSLSRRELEVSFIARGSRGGLNALRRDLADRARALPVDLSVAYAPGRHEIQLAEVLSRSDMIAKAGLTVRAVSPPAAIVELDRAVHVPDVKVSFNYTGAPFVEANVRPPRMGLYVAESLWEELKAEGRPIVLETAPVNLQSVQTDSVVSASVIPFVAGVPVKPDVEAVEVEITVSRLFGDRELTIPVGLRVPASWGEDDTWTRFVLRRKDPLDWLKKITVHGAKKDIDRLQPEHIDAYVVLTDDEKAPTTSWWDKPVQIRLPPDMQVQLVGDRPTVSLRMEERKDIAPP